MLGMARRSAPILYPDAFPLLEPQSAFSLRR